MTFKEYKVEFPLRSIYIVYPFEFSSLRDISYLFTKGLEGATSYTQRLW